MKNIFYYIDSIWKRFFSSDNFIEESLDKIIEQIAKIVLKNDNNRIRILNLSEKFGIHITPVHFYEPIPDLRNLPDEIFDKKPHYPELDFNIEGQKNIIKMLGSFSPEISELRNRLETINKYDFKNMPFSFDSMDGIIYYSIIRKYTPKNIIEVGSGYSTRVASEAAKKNSATSITSIEPFPRKFLKQELPELDLIEKSVQQVPTEYFNKLEQNDILFIDSSHISAIGSDVNYLFLHVIPELKSGVIIHVHDCCIPYEYGKGQIVEQRRNWNELYLVWAFLMGNKHYEILLSNFYLFKNYKEMVIDAFPIINGNYAKSGLWILKK